MVLDSLGLAGIRPAESSRAEVLRATAGKRRLGKARHATIQIAVGFLELQQRGAREAPLYPHSRAGRFLKTVLATSESRKVTLKRDHIFWRAQLSNAWREQEHDGETYEFPCPHPAARMKPLRGQASEGRANAKGIPCLYLATRKETAMSEVRPWVGSYVSVGQFKLLRDIDIVDCSRNHATLVPYYFEEPRLKNALM
jgi:hypothetical protein